MKIIWTFTLLMIPGVVSSISVTGYSGGRINITCKYERKYTDKAKYFCKGHNPGCSDLIKTEDKDKWVDSGRFSLYDNTSAAVFTVTIINLSEEDSGTYQCGVDIRISKDSYTEVKLNVLTDTDVPKATPSLLPSSSTPPSSSSSSSSSVFKTTTSNFTSESPNMLKGSSLIIPLVLVLLVLIIVCVLLLFLYKKHHSRGGDLSSQTGAGKNELVSHSGCDYDNIKDTQKQLPRNPSVSPDCVQKATGDSQNVITSAEDLNYAVVHFHKKADCPDSVRLRNNQDYSEYPAVNHLTA
ncbi:CMRF35-like molecule 2 [Sinocyclocheilus grahami]|uniref:CMRF35-like molecule 2 n=1 Tax=Sinocyclocheilus grahami TaxID=75366 RepID=UPI0007AC85BE|nr:PREDICTED: CMRF35-like molecule 2 [Sinocyclocheilus grahami]